MVVPVRDDDFFPSLSARLARVRLATGWILEVEGAKSVRFACPPEISDAALEVVALGPGLATLATQWGHAVLHGSCVAVGGDAAFSFVGPSGRGKSTLAALLGKRNHALLSDGMTLLGGEPREGLVEAGALHLTRTDFEPEAAIDADRRTRTLPRLAARLAEYLPFAGVPSETLIAHPGPPWFKLDDAALLELGHDPSVHENVQPWTRKRVLPARTASSNRSPPPLPLAHVFVLEDGDEISVEPLHGLAKLEALATNMYLAAFVPGPLPPLLFQQAAHVARCVPVSILKRPRGFEHTEHVLDFIESLATRGASRDPGSGASEGAASTR